MVTGCGNQESEEDLISYELHAYDATFNHTEEIIVKFDKKGNLKLAQLINEYDPNENAKCQKKQLLMK